MRRLTVLTLASVGLLLAACGDPAPAARTQPSSIAAAEQSAVMPEDAPPQEEAIASTTESDAATTNSASVGSCTADIGANAANRLVERCIAVSPATHPPCNASNACAMIQDEIDRSCDMYGTGEARPPECAA